MKMLFKLMKEIEETSKIPFKLKKLVGDIYASPNFCPKDGLVQATLKIANEDFIVEVAKEDERVLPLLSSYIKTNIKKLNDRKYNIILEVIDGKNIEEDELSKVYPFLMKEFQMLYIYTEKSFEEVFSIVQNGYSQDGNVVMEYEGKILVLGILDDIYDHAESLFETITSDIGGKIIISYCNIDRYSDLGDALKSSIKKIDLVKKFNISINILGENDLIFEEMVDNINDYKKKELINRFYDGSIRLDNEMIKTIEVFFNCGLNLSEGAKELYIHRNTLIYRLDKVEKYTGFDIRDFNQAALFKVIFVLFKEEKSKKIQKI